MVFQLNRIQLVTSASHGKGNILDVVIANKDDIVTRPRVHGAVESPVNTDHRMISFELSLSQTKSPRRKPLILLDYKKADWAGLCDHLLDSDFSVCYDSVDEEFIWTSIKLIAIEAMDRSIPKVRLRSHQFPVWFTSELRQHRNCLHTPKRSYRKHPNTSKKSKNS